MRVMQVHTRYREAGGEDGVVTAHHAALSSAGHVVHQHLTDNPGRVVQTTTALAGAVWNPRAGRRVAAAAQSFRPDVAHVHNTWFSMSPSVLGTLHRLNVPIVMTLHNYRLICANGLFMRDGHPCEDCLEGSAMSAVRHKCYRESRVASAVAAGNIAVHHGLGTWTRYVNRFLVLSAFAEQRMARSGLPRHQLLRMSNSVPDPGVRSQPPSRSQDVLFVGRLSKEKGVALLLEAWRRSGIRDLRLLVVGDGPERERLESLATPRVSFIGRLDNQDVVSLVHRARALLIPSLWYEGQPVVALEALSCGTPLLVSNLGGLSELLGVPQAGWTFEPSPDALVKALARLHDSHEIDRRGRLARDYYLAGFTPQVMTSRLEQVYADVISGGGVT